MWIARIRKISRHAIKDVLDEVARRGVGWEEVCLPDDSGVRAMLYPEKVAAESAVAAPGWDYIHAGPTQR